MQKDTPNYRAMDADRVIAGFGRKPTVEVSQKIKATLSQEQDRFLALDRFRPRQQQRLHGRSGDRGR